MMHTLLITLAVIGFSQATAFAGDRVADRLQMVRQIKEMATATTSETGIPMFNQRVLKAMSEVPRHEFVSREQAEVAYKNRPLAIDFGQTVSQPFIVALMTELLHLKGTERVLEVGTGSGYQAAVLSVLAAKVYTIEIIPQLGRSARTTLERLRYTNIRTKIGDGYLGWKEYAPFDAIIVTAAPDHVPPALVDQLKPNGRMVIPVGDMMQELMVVTKKADGTTINKIVISVRFVPLVRERQKEIRQPLR